MVRKNGVVQVDAVLVTVDLIQTFFLIHTTCLLIASTRANLAQIHALNALGKHVGTPFRWEKEVLEDLVDVIPIRVLHRATGKLDNKPVNQGSGHILHEIVVGVSSRDFKVDVEHKGERARNDDLVIRQLWH